MNPISSFCSARFGSRKRTILIPRRCARLGVNAGAAREAGQLWEQFLSIARAENLDITEREAAPGAIARCVLAGFPDQVAVRLDEGTLRCALVHNRRGVLARESVVHRARLLVASEIREIESSDGERQVLLTLATAIKEEWLHEFFPEAIEEKTEVTFDRSSRRVVGRTRRPFPRSRLGGKEIGSRSSGGGGGDARAGSDRGKLPAQEMGPRDRAMDRPSQLRREDIPRTGAAADRASRVARS